MLYFIFLNFIGEQTLGKLIHPSIHSLFNKTG